MKSVAIVGAGIGGLSSAARLARMGYKVDVYEKNECAGGKASEKRSKTSAGTFRWDCGPSLVTMPHILRDLFSFCGEQLEEHLVLKPLDPACRYFWTDGTVIDEDETLWKHPDVLAYLEYAKGLYETSAPLYLEKAPRDWWKNLAQGLFSNIQHLPKFIPTQSLAGLNRSFLGDPYICQIFDRFATYNGSSPFKTLSTFSIIPYIESTFGAWYPQGGVARIPCEIEKLARKEGATFHFNTEITDLCNLDADITLCNGDIITAYRTWLPECSTGKDIAEYDLSSSGYVMLLAVKKKFERLLHHNIFFSDHYGQEFDDLFNNRSLPSEPTIYIAVTSKSAPGGDAPEGCENWFVMVNSPAAIPFHTEDYDEVIFRRLEKFGIHLTQNDILDREIITPADFSKRHNAWQGSLYGWASHSVPTALFRPSMQHPYRQDLYFTGGTTHPGGGIPLALLSGKIASEIIREDFPV